MKNIYKLLVVLTIAIILIFAFVALRNKQSADLSSKALEISDKDENVLQFKGMYQNSTTNVSMLTAAQIKEEAKTYPAVYGNLPEKTLYKVTYSANDNGLLLIVDAENETVLKEFSTSAESLR
jgi:hypothetical protein